MSWRALRLRACGAWAVAGQTVTESVRGRVFVLLGLMAVGLVGLALHLPVVDTGEDRLELVQAMGVGGTTLFGTLLAASLAGAALPEDLLQQRIATVLATPIGRPAFLLGRLLGLAATLALLVIGVWLLSIAALPLLLRDRPADERARLLVARRARPAQSLIRAPLPLGEPSPSVAGVGAGERVPLATRRPVALRLDGLALARLPAGPLAGELRLDVRLAQPERFVRAYKLRLWLVDPATGAFGQPAERLGQPGRPLRFALPREHLTGDAVELRVESLDPRFRVAGASSDLLLYVEREPFAWNLAKGLLMVFGQLVLVAVLALALSTAAPSSVAVVGALLGALVGHLHPVLLEFARSLDERPLALSELVGGPGVGAGAGGEVGALSRAVQGAVVRLCQVWPDLQRFDPTTWLVERRSIPLSALGEAATTLALCGAPLLVLALVVFAYRDLDR